MDSLRGKKALLTGAGGGLGSEMARALGREGVQLALSGRGEAALRRLAAELAESGVRCVALPADLSDREQVGGLVARALSRSLRAEYIDSPLRFSVVSPGSVGGRGMFARGQAEGICVPRALRLTTPQAVARSVVETIRADAPEAIVYPGPIRPALMLGMVAPRLAERLNERLGLGQLFRPVAEARGSLGSRRDVRAGRGPGSQDQLLRS